MCFSQRIAVLEFKPGVGVSTADVDGLSSIFVTYFTPNGYAIVERSQIDRVIDEQNFQRSRMTEAQMVRVGQILNLSKIVVGDINVIMGEYNVDVRVLNVETGEIVARAGDTFNTSSYRVGMKNLALKLANQISIKSSNQNPRSSNSEEEWSYDKANDVHYLNGHGYVDLGLPSGLKWASCNIGATSPYTYGKYFAWGEVVPKASYDTSNSSQFNYAFDDIAGGKYDAASANWGGRWRLPRKHEFQELMNYCNWNFVNHEGKTGFVIFGPNGKFIFLPTTGLFDGNVQSRSTMGYYWSATTLQDGKNSCIMGFGENGPMLGGMSVIYGLNIRPVTD